MISRFGNSELQTLVNYLEITESRFTKYFKYITHQSNNLEWNRITNNYVSEKEMVQNCRT